MKRLGVLLLTSVLAFTGVSAAEWATETVMSSGQIITSSLRFGPDGNPVIAFCEDGALRVAFWRDSQWEVDDVSTGGNVRACDLALESSGAPHIAYWDMADYTIHHVAWNGSGWADSLIDGGDGAMSGPDCAICINSRDVPMIAYLRRSPDPGIFFVTPESGRWVSSRVDAAFSLGQAVSMALGTDGNPQLAYYDTLQSTLKYAVRGERFWNVQTVDSDGNVGHGASIAIDSDNLPHIAYSDRTIGGLRYAHFDGSDWLVSVVDSTGDAVAINEPTIQVRRDGLPGISYMDLSQSRLEYASFDGTSWQIEPVARRGHSSSLAMDSQDVPHVAYFRYSHNRWGLIYAQPSSDGSQK